MDVLTTAWNASGAPRLDGDSPVGSCARCGEKAHLRPTRQVISRVFTAFDGWAAPSGPGLCDICAWGFLTPNLRNVPHLVCRAPIAAHQLSREEVCHVLVGGELTPDLALIVPLRPGRKHLMPVASWGRITLADLHIAWTSEDAVRLEILTTLRSQGFGSRMLAEPSPPFSVLRRLPRSTWVNVMETWSKLTLWRTSPAPWLSLALHVTTPKEKS